MWLGSSAANAPSFASFVQVGEVKGDWCTQQLPSAATIFLPQQNRGADHKSNHCASASTGEGSSTSTTSALCTVMKPNLVLTEVYFLTLVPMDTEAQALIQILKSILDHRT